MEIWMVGFFQSGTDATGAFHPFWADSRTGTFQIYTAVVKVEEPAARGESQR